MYTLHLLNFILFNIHNKHSKQRIFRIQTRVIMVRFDWLIGWRIKTVIGQPIKNFRFVFRFECRNVTCQNKQGHATRVRDNGVLVQAFFAKGLWAQFDYPICKTKILGT